MTFWVISIVFRKALIFKIKLNNIVSIYSLLFQIKFIDANNFDKFKILLDTNNIL
jgi:hypothetical protein